MLGAALGAAGALGSAFIQNAGARNAQRRANKFNVKFWQMQNEYNDPSQQMSRLKAAGLNPHLIYGQNASGASGNAGSIAPAKAEPYVMNNPMGSIGAIADMKNTEATTDNVKAQNNVIQQEALLKNAQTFKTLSEGSSAKTKAEIDSILKTTSVDAAKENLRNLEQQTISQQIDNSFSSQAVRHRVKSLFYAAENAKSALHGQNLRNAMQKLENDLMRLGIGKQDPWYIKILGTGSDLMDKKFSKFDEEAKNYIQKLKNKF